MTNSDTTYYYSEWLSTTEFSDLTVEVQNGCVRKFPRRTYVQSLRRTNIAVDGIRKFPLHLFSAHNTGIVPTPNRYSVLSERSVYSERSAHLRRLTTLTPNRTVVRHVFADRRASRRRRAEPCGSFRFATSQTPQLRKLRSTGSRSS